jgi:dihydroflavonol-4-reductase
MRATVTGATGLIGNAIARALHERGDQVHALVRDATRARTMLPDGIELVTGDITEPSTLPAAINDAEIVFHAAGLPEQWARDAAIFDRVNTQGTVNVLDAAKAAGVRRVVYTSTMDVFRADAESTLRETQVDPELKHSAYERSKQLAEREVDRAIASGMDVVLLNPASVYGPSPIENGMNTFFARLLAGKAPMIPPGGASLAYIDSLTAAHLAAVEQGKNGERYLIADGHVTMKQLADITVAVAGLRRAPKVAPAWLLRSVAGVTVPLGKAFGLKPMLTHDELDFLLWDARCDTAKAERELGFVPTPIEDGVRRTVEHLRATS